MEFLSLISIALDWVPHVHMVKYKLTFSEVLCTEQTPGGSVQEHTFYFWRKHLEGIETSF